MTTSLIQLADLVEYRHAAAGHPGVQTDASGSIVAKPCTKGEIDFYESAQLYPTFSRFIPVYLGTLKTAATVAADPEISEPAEWKPSAGQKIKSEDLIVLENVAAGLSKPNTLDVKLGARLWDDSAPPAKRQRLDEVSDKTTSRPLGFRIAGMKTYQGADKSKWTEKDIREDGYREFGKEYGRTFSKETVRVGFEEFFLNRNAGIGRNEAKTMIRVFLEDVRELQKTLQTLESRMYSASLLFAYEGDGNVLREKLEAIKSEDKDLAPPVSGESQDLNIAAANDQGASDNEDDGEEEEDEPETSKIQVVKLIDFAHAIWTPGQGPDENLLHGIRSVTSVLEDMITDLSA